MHYDSSTHTTVREAYCTCPAPLRSRADFRLKTSSASDSSTVDTTIPATVSPGNDSNAAFVLSAESAGAFLPDVTASHVHLASSMAQATPNVLVSDLAPGAASLHSGIISGSNINDSPSSIVSIAPEHARFATPAVSMQHRLDDILQLAGTDEGAQADEKEEGRLATRACTHNPSTVAHIVQEQLIDPSSQREPQEETTTDAAPVVSAARREDIPVTSGVHLWLAGIVGWDVVDVDGGAQDEVTTHTGNNGLCVPARVNLRQNVYHTQTAVRIRHWLAGVLNGSAEDTVKAQGAPTQRENPSGAEATQIQGSFTTTLPLGNPHRRQAPTEGPDPAGHHSPEVNSPTACPSMTHSPPTANHQDILMDDLSEPVDLRLGESVLDSEGGSTLRSAHRFGQSEDLILNADARPIKGPPFDSSSSALSQVAGPLLVRVEPPPSTLIDAKACQTPPMTQATRPTKEADPVVCPSAKSGKPFRRNALLDGLGFRAFAKLDAKKQAAKRGEQLPSERICPPPKRYIRALYDDGRREEEDGSVSCCVSWSLLRAVY